MSNEIRFADVPPAELEGIEGGLLPVVMFLVGVGVGIYIGMNL